ncbi:IPT/TIG domain-containing protein [Flagellimonas myxillae]|uniref:IPT/TIG domain-containing protein n=1 Tax=Flagellimonas myxillae TaxID=2942214 RepID=UPI00201EC96C|nr:IPT/TIG domain-containing protein [Muricauda myxillae]MCL6266052.1 IPT/TIG domain-containing protein [Muricauda myxillae]
MKVLKSYDVKKWLVFGLPILAMCLIMACSKKENDSIDDVGNPDDDPAPETMTFTSFSPVEGERGSTLELTGTNFSTTPSENTVTFGTAGGAVTDATSTLLTVTVPDNATSGTITVSTGTTTVTSTDEFEVYEPAKWTQVTSYPNEEGRTLGISFTINGIIYSGLGSTSDHLTEHEIWSYDPNLDSWDQRADFLNTEDKLTGSTVFIINNKAYVIGGSKNDEDSSEVWEYNPNVGQGGTWTLMDTPFPGSGKKRATGFSINGKGYVVGGGYFNGEFTQEVDEVWMYDPIDDSWTVKMGFPGPAFTRGLGFVVDDKAYVHLGRTEKAGDGNGSNEFWEYTPSNDSWIEKASFSGKRSGAFGFAIDDKVYLGYGATYDQNQQTSIKYQDFIVYNPIDNSWTDLINPEGVTESSGAIGLSVNGVGYMGLGSGDTSDTFWKFEPRKKL